VAKTNKGRPRRDWRRTVFLIISVLIVLSMVLSMAVAFAPTPAP
jgi:predicted nucleic acid-binding Zn ribbon protein